MSRFRLMKNAGPHIMGRGQGRTSVKPGQIIETDQDLDRDFPGKFVRLDGPQRAPVVHDARVIAGGGKTTDPPEHVKEKRLEAEAKKARKTGAPVPTAKATVRDPDYEEVGDEEEGLTDPNDVADDEEVEANRQEDADGEEGVEPEDNEEPEIEDPPSKFGEDMTHSFPGAKEQKLKVFRDNSKRKFTVVKERRPDTPVHEKAFKTRAETLKFVEDFSKP